MWALSPGPICLWPHPPTPASYLVCQRWLWFPTQTGLFLTSELCCPPALDASLDSTNSFLLFLGLRSGVLLTTVRCSSSLLPEHLCLPLSTEIKASPRLFSHVSLLGVQLYWGVCSYAEVGFLLGSSRLLMTPCGAPTVIPTGRLLLC